MKIFTPLQLNCQQRVLEVDRKFGWVVSASLFVKLSTSEAVLVSDAMAETLPAMGNVPRPDPGLPKPMGEWLLSGKAYSPDMEPVPAMEVAATIGNQTKRIWVFGDREWRLGIPTQPNEFIEMPLDYSLAFGGVESPLNPEGKGYKSTALPNLEFSNEVLTNNNKLLPPAAFGPIDQTWHQRAQYQGTYDKGYMKNYFPGFPADIDRRFFLMAAEDQRLPNHYYSGDESFEFRNMHPSLAVIRGQLPGYQVRCVYRDTSEMNAIKELPLKIDTLWFFPEQDLVQIIYRGTHPVHSDDAAEISDLLLGFESKDEPIRSKLHYEVALENRILNYDPIQHTMNATDLIPTDAKTALQALQDSVAMDAPENPLSENLKAKQVSLEALASSQLAKESDKIKSQSNANNISSELETTLQSILKPDKKIIEEDPKISALLENLDCILPGIQGEGALDLSNLSAQNFEKISQVLSDYFREVESDLEKVISDEIISSEKMLSDIKKKLVSSITVEEKLKHSDEMRLVEQSLEELKKVKIGGAQENLPLSALPRADISELESQLESIQRELDKAQNQIQTSEEVGEKGGDMCTQIEDTRKNIENTLLPEIKQIKEDYFDLYRMAAHMTPEGCSPHSDPILVMAEFKRRLYAKDVSYGDWACLDLTGMDLRDVNFSHCFLEQVNFSQTQLDGVDFSNSILVRSNFTGAKGSNVNLNDTNLGGIVFRSAKFSHCEMINVKLSESQFESCVFDHCKVKPEEALAVNFDGTKFNETDFTSWLFLDSKLTQCEFSHCRLTECTFINSKLERVKFSGSDLPSTVWTDTELMSVDFDFSNLSQNCIVFSDDEDISTKFYGVDFRRSNVEKSNLQGLNFQRSIFSNSILDGSNLSGADLRNSDFSEVSAKEALFTKANMQGANFSGADLMNAIMGKTTLVEVDLQRSNLYSVDFMRATVRHTNFKHANLEATILKDWRPS